mgnify:CR=1 FL=1
MENKNDLDALIMEHGQEFNNNINKLIKSEELLKDKLVYEDTNQVMPGQFKMPTSDDVALDKEDARDNLIKHAAMFKLQKENEEYRKMSDDEKVKDYICQAQYYRETNDFYHKNGYEMSGKQKRYIKRAIETAWKKGKLKVTPEQREDILFELSKASRQTVPAQAPTQGTTETNISENIKDLNSLIFR